ncbi:hypothetical protein AGMMS49949_09510 [Alphaproteobacteria bacterium]|nr:hypothetical protein AGMMS49949_09510 [Alphaproteobacteria bacterium]
MKDGVGVEKTPEESFEGNFEKNERKGRGEAKNEAGWNYDGQWRKGEKNGTGLLRKWNEALGELTGTRGTTVELEFYGDWTDGRREGYGVAVEKLGQVKHRYEGCWRNDLKHGTAVITFHDGSRLKGIFVNSFYDEKRKTRICKWRRVRGRVENVQNGGDRGNEIS